MCYGIYTTVIGTGIDTDIGGDTDYAIYTTVIGTGIDTDIDTDIDGDTDYGIGILSTSSYTTYTPYTAYDAGKSVYRIDDTYRLDGIRCIHSWAPSELYGVTPCVYGRPKFPYMVGQDVPIWWAKIALYGGPKFSYMVGQSFPIWWAKVFLYGGLKFSYMVG